MTQASNNDGQSSSNSSGTQDPSKPRSRNRNRNRNRNRKKKTGAEGQGSPENKKTGAGPNRTGGGKSNNRKRRPNRTGPKLTGFEKVERSYLNLLEKHLEARRKYYELFHRADPRQLEKLERNFSRTADDMRKYVQDIKPEFQEEFQQKFNGLKRDLTYSTNHGINPDEEPVAEQGNFSDPHLLPSQVEHEFSNDEEESVGTMEDYQQYKGL